MAINKSPELKTGPAVIKSRRDPKNIAFGGIFALLGVSVMMIPFGLFPGFASEGGSETAFIIIFGLVFTLAGIAIIRGGKSYRIDLATRRVETLQGSFVTTSRKSEPLDNYRAVRVEKNEGDSDSPTTWPVSLAGDKDAKLVMEAPESFAEAMAKAREVAASLNLPIEDKTLGTVTVVHEAGRLEESLSEKIRRKGEDIHTLPPRPQVMKSGISSTGEGVAVTIPHRKVGKVPIFRTLFTLLIFYLGWIFIKWMLSGENMTVSPGSELVPYILACGAIYGLAKLLLYNVSDLSQRFSWAARITASPAYLRIEENEGYTVSKREIPAADIQELVYQYNLEESGLQEDGNKLGAPDGTTVTKTAGWMVSHYAPKGITAVTATEKFKFCENLPHAEVKYIHALIKKTLAGQ